MKGFINVLKAPGITSSTVVSIIRYIIGIKKVGHAGTLDPAACGVLPVMIGSAVKLFDYLADEKKEYISEFVFGIDTDTLDMQGKIIKKCDKKIIKSQVLDILPNYKGCIKQLPPKVSAISINGKKAYNLHRQGIEFEILAREITINKFELIRQTKINSFLFKISCSKGTYIRSLCRDIAGSLNTCGYVNYINRTKSGCFHLENAYSIEELRNLDFNKIIIPIDYPINYMNRADIEKKDLKRLLNGVKIDYNRPLNDVNRVYYNNIFIGLGRKELSDNIKYLKIFKKLVNDEEFS